MKTSQQPHHIRYSRIGFIATLLSAPLLSQNNTAQVFVGFPQRTSINMIGNNETQQLDKKAQDEFVCLITRRAGKFYWASRDGKELVRNVSGDYITFTAVDGSGYVRIAPKMSDLPLDYMEHLIDKLFTITYWGKSSVFRDQA